MHTTTTITTTTNGLLCIFSQLLEKTIQCLLYFRTSHSFKIFHTLLWIIKSVQISFPHILFQSQGWTTARLGYGWTQWSWRSPPTEMIRWFYLVRCLPKWIMIWSCCFLVIGRWCLGYTFYLKRCLVVWLLWYQRCPIIEVNSKYRARSSVL